MEQLIKGSKSRNLILRYIVLRTREMSCLQFEDDISYIMEYAQETSQSANRLLGGNCSVLRSTFELEHIINFSSGLECQGKAAPSSYSVTPPSGKEM